MSGARRRLNFGGARIPIILQSEITECGLACLAMIAGYYGRETDLAALRRTIPTALTGVTLKTLIQNAGLIGLAARPLRLEPEQLKGLRGPAILHWDLSHFVVLKKVGRRGVTIIDPAQGERRYSLQELSPHMTGIALELTPTASFERKREIETVGLGRLIGRVIGLKRAIGQAVILSLILQAFVLASPFYMQLAVDQAIVRGDGDLLLGLAIGFGLFTAINVAAATFRSIILLHLGTVLTFQMTVSLIHHLLRLPIGFFERRHIGDLISRFHSTEPIRELMTEGLIAAIVDGAMAAATLTLAFLYSWRLALIASTAIIVYAVVRFALLGSFRERTADYIAARAKQDSTFIETLRAVQSIKLFGRETERETLWLNQYAGMLNQGVRIGWLQVQFKTLSDLLYGAETVATIYFGARFVIDGSMTVGMLFAFMAYKQQLLDKTTRLIEKAVELRMLKLHLGRLSDIALAEQESGYDRSPTALRPLAGAVEFRAVTYRYSEAEPWILDGASFSIQPGEFVAIAGPSGGGKTTLIKILLGLFAPTGGEVLIDGYPISGIGLQAYRAQVGAVMQDDTLLTGSIADNIAFFDAEIDFEWMQGAAKIASIHDDIMRMPMGYHSLIGDMGGMLSGGQRQRVLLARALYRRPKILVMDEGTSHLDPELEVAINAAIAQLNITRIVIAHRPQTIRAAQRAIRLVNGRIDTGEEPPRQIGGGSGALAALQRR